MKIRTVFLVFFPAILIAVFVLFIRVIQYEPLYPSAEEIEAFQQKSNVQIPLFPDDPILGSPKAGKTIVVFEDFGCPACAVQMEQLKALADKHPRRFKVVWKPLSVTRIPQSSYDAHRYGFCAQKQKRFEEFASLAFANQQNLGVSTLQEMAVLAGLDEDRLRTCLQSGSAETYLQNNELVARAIGVQSVPAVFIDNVEVEPPDRLTGWESLLGL